MNKIIILFAIFLGGCSTNTLYIDDKFIDDRKNDFDISIIDYNNEYLNIKNKGNLQKTISFFENLKINILNSKNKTKFERLSDLNNFFNNEFKYKLDADNYGMNDYWASIYEMIQAGFNGDCEDFTFAKIQLAELYSINRDDIFIGFTKSGKHIFPVFFDGTNYVVSDTNGKLKTLESYSNKYSDLKVYSYSEIWTTKDFIFRSGNKDKILVKMVGMNQ